MRPKAVMGEPAKASMMIALALPLAETTLSGVLKSVLVLGPVLQLAPEGWIGTTEPQAEALPVPASLIEFFTTL